MSNFNTKYEPRFCKIGRELAEKGANLAMIGKTFGVAGKTVSLWKNKYPDFGEALTTGTSVATDIVESVLFKRATGYTIKEQKVVVIDKKILVVSVEREILPDTASIIFWLINRRSEDWKNKHDHEHAGGFSVTIEGSDAACL